VHTVSFETTGNSRKIFVVLGGERELNHVPILRQIPFASYPSNELRELWRHVFMPMSGRAQYKIVTRKKLVCSHPGRLPNRLPKLHTFRRVPAGPILFRQPAVLVPAVNLISAVRQERMVSCGSEWGVLPA